MKEILDRRFLDHLASQSDERLWHTLSMLTAGLSAGWEGGRKKVDAKRIARIRALLAALTDEDVARINELAEVYQNGSP